MWILFSMLSAVFAAIMSVTIKIGLKDINPFLSLAIRTFWVFIFSVILILSTKVLNLKISKNLDILGLFKGKNLLWILVVSLATFLTWLFYFLAIKNGTPSKVMAIDKLSIVLIVILSSIFLKEKITLSVVIGIVLLIGGSLLIVFN